MKIQVEYVAEGIVDYAEEAMLPMMQGWQMWTAAAVLELIRARSEQLVPLLAENEMLKALGLVDADGLVDMDAAIGICKSTTKKHGKLAFELPMFGKFALSESDFDEIADGISKAAGK